MHYVTVKATARDRQVATTADCKDVLKECWNAKEFTLQTVWHKEEIFFSNLPVRQTPKITE